MKSYPHRCEPCVEEASYFGHLVFGDGRPPKCKVHGVVITPVAKPAAFRWNIDELVKASRACNS